MSLFVHNLISKAICSECTVFVYNFVFQKKEKQHSRNLSHFENESEFRKRTSFWKWKLILKPILKIMKHFWQLKKFAAPKFLFGSCQLLKFNTNLYVRWLYFENWQNLKLRWQTTDFKKFFTPVKFLSNICRILGWIRQLSAVEPN